jgi:hypothetical protein
LLLNLNLNSELAYNYFIYNYSFYKSIIALQISKSKLFYLIRNYLLRSKLKIKYLNNYDNIFYINRLLFKSKLKKTLQKVNFKKVMLAYKSLQYVLNLNV